MQSSNGGSYFKSMAVFIDFFLGIYVVDSVRVNVDKGSDLPPTARTWSRSNTGYSTDENGKKLRTRHSILL